MVALAVLFFALMLAWSSAGADMSGAELFGLVVSLLVFGYLVYALMRGERL